MTDVIIRASTHKARGRLHTQLLAAGIFAEVVYCIYHRSKGGFFRAPDSPALRKCIAQSSGCHVTAHAVHDFHACNPVLHPGIGHRHNVKL